MVTRVRILSLNLWNYRQDWRARRARIARLIAERQPDIVALQEVRRDPRFAFGLDQAAQLARRTGLRHVYAPAMRYWPAPQITEGLAILTPHPIIARETVPLFHDPRDRRDPNRRIALCVVAALPDAPPLAVWVTHLNQFAPAQERSATLLRDAVTACDGSRPPLLAGDFNAMPDRATHHIITEHGLRDMWEFAGEGVGYTYPADAPTERIDYLFAGPGWEATRMERIGVGTRDYSDHCGLWAELVLS